MFWVPDFGSTDRLVAPMFWVPEFDCTVRLLAPMFWVPDLRGTDRLAAPMFRVPDFGSTDRLVAPMFWVPDFGSTDRLVAVNRDRVPFSWAWLLSVVVRSDTPGSQGQDGRTSTGISRCRIQGHRIVQTKTAEGRLAKRPTEDFEVGFY